MLSSPRRFCFLRLRTSGAAGSPQVSAGAARARCATMRVMFLTSAVRLVTAVGLAALLASACAHSDSIVAGVGGGGGGGAGGSGGAPGGGGGGSGGGACLLHNCDDDAQCATCDSG